MNKNADLGIPTTYLKLILELSAERGVPEDALLRGLKFDSATLKHPNLRVEQSEAASLLLRALHLTQDPGLAFAIGLNSQMNTHGFVGMGLSAFQSFRQVLEFGQRFVSLRTPFLRLNIRTEEPLCLYEVSEAVPLGPLREPVFELFLAGLWRMTEQLAGQHLRPVSDIEILFDFAQTAHFEHFATQLPRCRFNQAVNALRFPLSFLDIPLQTADSVTAELVRQQCEQELKAIGGLGVTLKTQVEAVLEGAERDIPSVDTLAKSFNMSTRSLKRKLNAEGSSYSQLRDSARMRRAKHLLLTSEHSIADIAEILAYRDPANFTRAFRKWLGQSPSAFRLANKAKQD